MLVNRSFWLIVSLNEDGRIAVVQAEEWESRIIFVPVCDPSFSVEWNPKPPEPPLNLGWMIRLARRSRSFQRSGTWSRSFQWPRSGSQTQLKQSSHIALIAFISNLESYCIYSRRILSPCRNKTTAFTARAVGFLPISNNKNFPFLKTKNGHHMTSHTTTHGLFDSSDDQLND